MDIAAWLRELGLERYEQAFRENDIDADILPKLTTEDLSSIGVASVGHRRKLLKAIAELSAVSAAAEARDDAADATQPQPRADVAGPPEAERRQLTVLFCDLVGSTELASRLDPEDTGALMRAYHAACQDVVTRWGGHVAKYMGDGMLAYFGYPHAHEDDVERAVRAGLELAAAVEGLNTDNDASLAGRVGIATGLVVVGELIGEGAAQEHTVVGDTPNLAARLQALAAPGAVVVAASTRRLLGGLFELDDLGQQGLKGFAEPVRAFRVVAESRAESRFEALHGRHLTPLVGREHEIDLLLDRWERAKDGEGQVVLLSGEPGIGKSRVVQAFRDRLADEFYIPLSHYCSPYHVNSTLYPVIGLLERAAGFERGDPPERRLEKLEALLGQGTERLDEAVSPIADLLGIPTGERYPALALSPQRKAQRTLKVLVEQVEGLAAKQPVLIVHEDVHWIDPTTLEVLGLVIECVQRLPVLILITYRPEFTPPWTGHANVARLTLARLTRRDGSAMIERVTGGKALPADIRAQIVERADGVPLFLEELTKNVLESGLLRDAGDQFELDGPVPSRAIPSSLHDSLMARLDRLGPVKGVAQIGAVIGREFSHELLAAVAARPEAELTSALDRLIASELIFRRGTGPEAIYSFKHALVHDVAYDSLLKSKRRQLHARVSHVLQEHSRNLAETEPEVLAHHLTEAGSWERAITSWDAAGQRAVGRFANFEAVGHFTKALELLGALPEDEARDRRELRLRVALIVPLIAIHGFGSIEVERCAKRAKEVSDRLGDAEHRFAVTRALWNNSLLRHPVPETLALSVELLRLAGIENDPAQLAVAHRARGYSLYIGGRLAGALDHLTRGIRLADAVTDVARFQIYGEYPAMVCRAYAALTLTMLGRLEQAGVLSSDAVNVARRLANPHTLAWSLVVAAQDSVVRRQFETARVQAEEAVALAREHHLPQWLGGATVYHGCALAQAGDLDRGIAEMEHGVAHWLGTGAVLHSTHHRAMLVAACCRAGDLQRARTHLTVALCHVEQFGERYAEAELHRLKAQVRRREGAPLEKVEAALQRAIEIAEAQTARLWQLRAATDLARLWRDHGRRVEARDLLAPIYGWFSDGFDALDLKEAKALLDELR